MWTHIQASSNVGVITYCPDILRNIVWEQTESLQIAQAPIQVKLGFRRQFPKLPGLPATNPTRHEPLPKDMGWREFKTRVILNGTSQ
jgi:hypothetical protein